VLVQTKGCARSFQPAMKVRILVLRLRTDLKTPRRMAWRSTMPNQTRDQVHPGGVGRGEVDLESRVRLVPFPHGWVLVGGVVVHHQVQLDRLAGGLIDHVAIGPFDLLEEGQELGVAVPRLQRGGCRSSSC